ncbi:MAG: anti-sigma F factor [Clostridia bacterium]|nr:anti-sigma F factor [Clostridia bacterium]
MKNFVKVEFPAESCNESLSRALAAAFVSEADPTVSELSDIRTAVSEAVTNAIVHGYGGKGGTIYMTMQREERKITITIQDIGCGIQDIEKAKEPFFTTAPQDERSGMGFAVMEAFTDAFYVESRPGEGTKIVLVKHLSE